MRWVHVSVKLKLSCTVYVMAGYGIFQMYLGKNATNQFSFQKSNLKCLKSLRAYIVATFDLTEFTQYNL